MRWGLAGWDLCHSTVRRLAQFASYCEAWHGAGMVAIRVLIRLGGQFGRRKRGRRPISQELRDLVGSHGLWLDLVTDSPQEGSDLTGDRRCGDGGLLTVGVDHGVRIEPPETSLLRCCGHFGICSNVGTRAADARSHWPEPGCRATDARHSALCL
jgi:hypothetical protein